VTPRLTSPPHVIAFRRGLVITTPPARRIMQDSRWRWPQAAPQATASRLHYLSHSASLVDLHDPGWGPGWRERPSSPTESSSSSASDVLTPTASTADVSESRSSTPTPSTPPQNLFGSITYKTFASKNPWRNSNHETFSPPISPKSSPHSNSPQSYSRASTPTAVAPQPIRPVMVHVATDPIPRVSPPPALPPPTPLPFSDVENDKLPIQPITNDLIAHTLKLIPSMITRSGWKRSNSHWDWVYQWAIQQPKTALLLWMCDDLQAWPRANFYQLKDSNLPFQVKDLDDIAAEPEKVVRLQWKVAITPLPRNGQHVEFQTQEHIPLQEYGPLVRTNSSTKTINKVRYQDGTDSQMYVRKRFEISADRPQDKQTILEQIRRFNRLEHDNVAKIMSSYARGSVVAFVTPLANHNLEQYLVSIEPQDFSQSELLLGWAADLCSGLAYLHQKRLEHKNIRPQKVLIDTSFNRIYFSVFSISPPARSSSYDYLYRRYSDEPAYIYAAPEVIERRDVRQPADVFSLGCCLLDMLSVAKGQPVAEAQEYRSAISHDLSFHANLDRVNAWIRQLAQLKIPSAISNRNASTAIPPNHMLKLVLHMLKSDPEKRPDMKSIVRSIEDMENHRGLSGRRRNSDIVPSSGYAMSPPPQQPTINLVSNTSRSVPIPQNGLPGPPRTNLNVSTSPSMRNPANDFSSLNQNISVEYASPPRNPSMRRNALADFSSLQSALPHEVASPPRAVVPNDIPSPPQRNTPVQYSNLAKNPPDNYPSMRNAPTQYSNPTKNPPDDFTSMRHTPGQYSSLAKNPPDDFASMRKNAIDEFMNPARQTQPEFKHPLPRRNEFPRESAIWDLQSLAGYYRGNGATPAAVYGDESGHYRGNGANPAVVYGDE
jgi:serine/threonine protein kinase